MRKVLVLGAGGFIGGHLVTRLKALGYWVRGADIKAHEYKSSDADEFSLCDLRDENLVRQALGIDGGFDEIYQLAADMGGAGYIFTGEHDAEVMHNSMIINLHTAKLATEFGRKYSKLPKLFYSSSACIYPQHNQTDPQNPNCAEDSAYPAHPDSEYGWEKLVSERMYLSYYRNYGLPVRIARFHNIFGPLGSWNNGREKAPAAICRKVAVAEDGGVVEIWGDGKQTRSFLYIDECLDGVLRLMDSKCTDPVNIGSDQMISIDQLVDMVVGIAGKKIAKKHLPGPTGVRGRNSDNRFIAQRIGWKPEAPLAQGLQKTYRWIAAQVGK